MTDEMLAQRRLVASGIPLRRTQPCLMCVVVTVSMSPSHLPVEKPFQVCAAYSGGCGRPSIQIVRVCSNVLMYCLMAIKILRLGIALLPDAKLERTAIDVRRDVHLALMLGQRQPRRIPAERPLARAVGDRQTEVVAELRTGNALGLIFGKARAQASRQVGRGPCRRRPATRIDGPTIQPGDSNASVFPCCRKRYFTPGCRYESPTTNGTETLSWPMPWRSAHRALRGVSARS